MVYLRTFTVKINPNVGQSYHTCIPMGKDGPLADFWGCQLSESDQPERVQAAILRLICVSLGILAHLN